MSNKKRWPKVVVVVIGIILLSGMFGLGIANMVILGNSSGVWYALVSGVVLFAGCFGGWFLFKLTGSGFAGNIGCLFFCRRCINNLFFCGCSQW